MEIVLGDAEPWVYKQWRDDIVMGAGGRSGAPFSIGLEYFTDHYKPGDNISADVVLMNHQEDAISISKPTTFEVNVFTHDHQLVWSTETAPLNGVFPGQLATMKSTIVWDQRDLQGKLVPEGEYWINVTYPQAVEGNIKGQGKANHSISGSIYENLRIFIGK